MLIGIIGNGLITPGVSAGHFTAGPNLVVNGNFDADLSGWTPGNSGATWSAGTALIHNAFGYLKQTLTTVVGTAYTITFSWTRAGGDITQTFLGVGTTADSYAIMRIGYGGTGMLVNGANSYTFTATATSTVILIAQADAGDWTRDNVSVTAGLPAASMSFVFTGTTGNLALGFTTFSGASASAWWDYGDGSALSQSTSPGHTYAGNYAYTVTRYGDPSGPQTLSASKKVSSLSLAGLTSLSSITLTGSVNAGNLNLAGMTHLAILTVNSATSITGLTLTGCTGLTRLDVESQSALTGVTGLPVAATNFVAFISDNFTSANIDTVLVALAAGSISGGYCNVTMGAGPGSAGLTAKAILLGRGWTYLDNNS